MCGRARCTLRTDDITRACYLNGRPVRHLHMHQYRPSYNVSPGRNLPVVRLDDGSGSDGQGAALHCMKWGLIPSFTKKAEKPDHFKMFNARSESISQKASFRRLVPKNRCLVVVEGFYEWKKDGSKKQSYYIHFKDGRPLIFAALFDSWKNSEGETLYTFTIVTTSSSSALEWLHDRMPVILGDKESTDAWLNTASQSSVDTVLKPYEQSDLVWYPVTPEMGKPSFDGPECIKQIPFRNEESKPILKFFNKKGSDSGQKADSYIRTPDKDPQANQPKSIKKEPQCQDNMNYHSDHVDDDSKCNVSAVPGEQAINFQVKRDYDEFLADTKPFHEESDKQCTSPVKKRGNTRRSTDKQSTLFSYFGKG